MKRSAVGHCLLAATAATLSGCYSRSFPVADSFTIPSPADCRALPAQCSSYSIVHLFADANGTFYPNGWQTHPELGPKVREAGTLYLAAEDRPDLRSHIDEQQKALLSQIEARSAPAARVFILVHGYNNTVAEAAQAYGQLESDLNLTPGDLVIRFYWDGLTSSSRFGSGRIWFWAAGNSQLVGSRALRDVLRQVRNKDVFLIGHSRGTSVILSALGNPVYNPRFKDRTQELASRWKVDDMLAPRPLETNGNRIRVLVAAPAVDKIDFCDAVHQPETGGVDCDRDKMRPLPITAFSYTVNERDPVLNKFIGLSRRFNPTGFGLRFERGAEMRARYHPLMHAYCLPPTRQHGFTWYVRQPAFQRMLHDHGLLRPDRQDAAVTEANFRCSTEPQPPATGANFSPAA